MKTQGMVYVLNTSFRKHIISPGLSWFSRLPVRCGLIQNLSVQMDILNRLPLSQPVIHIYNHCRDVAKLCFWAGRVRLVYKQDSLGVSREGFRSVPIKMWSQFQCPNHLWVCDKTIQKLKALREPVTNWLGFTGLLLSFTFLVIQ